MSKKNAMILEDLPLTHEEGCIEDADFLTEVHQHDERLQIKPSGLIKDRKNFDGLPKSKLQSRKLLALNIPVVLENSEFQGLITQEALETFQAQASTWLPCEYIENSGIPCFIVHRDIRTSNVAVPLRSDEKFLFFDWYFGCVALPFVHLNEFREGLRRMRESDAQIEARVEMYLTME